MSEENIYSNIKFITPYSDLKKPEFLIKESNKISYNYRDGKYQLLDTKQDSINLYAAIKYDKQIPEKLNNENKNKYYYIPYPIQGIGNDITKLSSDLEQSDVYMNGFNGIGKGFRFMIQDSIDLFYFPTPSLKDCKSAPKMNPYSDSCDHQDKYLNKKMYSEYMCNNICKKNNGKLIADTFKEKEISKLSNQAYGILYELCNGEDKFRISNFSGSNPAIKGCLRNSNKNFYIIGSVPAFRSEFINMNLKNYQETESKDLYNKLNGIMNYKICKKIKDYGRIFGEKDLKSKSLVYIHDLVNKWLSSNINFSFDSDKMIKYSEYAKLALTSVNDEDSRFSLIGIPKSIYYDSIPDINKSPDQIITFDLNDGKGFRSMKIEDLLKSYSDLDYYSNLVHETNSIDSASKSFVEKFELKLRNEVKLPKISIEAKTFDPPDINISNLTIPKSDSVKPNFMEIIMKNNNSKFINNLFKFTQQTKTYECNYELFSNINNSKSKININGIYNEDPETLDNHKLFVLDQFNKICHLLMNGNKSEAKIELMKIFGTNKTCYDYVINSGLGFNVINEILGSEKLESYLSKIDKDTRFFPNDSSVNVITETSISGNKLDLEVLRRLKIDKSLMNNSIFEELTKDELNSFSVNREKISTIPYYSKYIKKTVEKNLEDFELAGRYACQQSSSNQSIEKELNICYPIYLKNSKTNEFEVYTDYYLNGMRAKINRNPCNVTGLVKNSKSYNESNLEKTDIYQAAMIRFYYYWYKINQKQVNDNLSKALNSFHVDNKYFTMNIYLEDLKLEIKDQKYILKNDPFTEPNQPVYVTRQRMKKYGDMTTKVARSLLTAQFI